MEAHAFEAVRNNVFGTLNVAMAAAGHGVDDFVMISSDKAVRPTSIMGATKRVAELLVRSLQNGGVKFVSVRFGNVLGSNGSVVPIFKEQIARGGPVTVTHPEMQRYFMTTPEACQLVLQSSTMAQGGEVFILDMGEPILILDLARTLIRLSGLRPDEDIKIQFTGLRPGEKLREELTLSDEDIVPTGHEKIKRFIGSRIPWTVMEQHLAKIQRVNEIEDEHELSRVLKEIIPDYHPAGDLALPSQSLQAPVLHSYQVTTTSWTRG
jgi:FlaA1/EpsC-like NDP-sugar epimerase